METIPLVTCLILFLNVTLLSILVPGGPIENRSFKHLKRFIFLGFNIFLISLGLTSIILCYFLLLGNILAFKISLFLGVLYFIIYMLDLGKIFPKTSTNMSNTLMLIEIVNSMFALLLIIFSLVKLSI